jgi:hypothetical protein
MDLGTFGGWAGGILGGLFGVLGGVMGTYFTIKNTNGPRERAFVVKGSVVGWALITAFIVAVWLIPRWYNMLLFVPYPILLLFSIRKWNQTQLRIRNEESGHVSDETMK